MRRFPFHVIATIVVLAGTSPLWAEEEKKEAGGKESTLTWHNGERLTGEATGASKDRLTWKSDLFAEPVALDFNVLRSLERTVDLHLPEGSHAVTLRDGSRIFGEVMGLDEQTLTLQSSTSGRMPVRREALRSIHRIRGGNILWSGPFGDAGWEHGGEPPERRRWHGVGHGSLRTVAWRQRVTLPLDLPERVEVEFELESSARPEFEIRLQEEEKAVFVSSWDDEIVMRRGNLFHTLTTLKKSDRSVAYRIYWDRKAGTGAVCSRDGVILGQWKTAPNMDKDWPPFVTRFPDVKIGGNKLPPDGFSLINHGPDLTLTSLRVRRWDGILPEKEVVDPGQPRIELGNGAVVSGSPAKLEKGQLVLKSASDIDSIPFSEVASVHFPESSAGKAEADTELRLVKFSDSTQIEGRIVKIADGRLEMETPFSSQPFKAPANTIREILFHTSGDFPDFTPLKELDALTIGEKTLHGTWHPSEGKRLRWVPPGAGEPVTLAGKEFEGELRRALPPNAEWPPTPALFHLSTQEIAPGQLVAVEDDGQIIRVESELFEQSRFTADQLEAVVFSPPQIVPDGFGDPGWQTVRGEVSSEPDSDKVVLETGSGWGHPYLLQGNELKFAFQPLEGNGTLRLRLFANGIQTEERTTHFLFMHYGSQIHFGVEGENPDNLEHRRNVSVPNDKPAPVQIRWDDEKVTVTINGSTLELGEDEKYVRGGLGLIFETANLWNNGERPLELTDFSLQRGPGFSWAPPVNVEAKEKALFLPRFLKDDPPRHLLFAPNGDLLRGTVTAATVERFAFRTGLDTIQIPRERTVAALWLDQPKSEEEKENGKPPEAGGSAGNASHWLILRNGGQFGLDVSDFGPDFVTGHSAMLGECRIPVAEIRAIRAPKPEPAASVLALSNWQLNVAPQPDPDRTASQTPLLAKPAPEIKLNLLGGGEFELAEHQKKVVVLDFWATWCGPCVRAIPELVEALSGLSSDRVELVAVNQAEPPETIQRFLEQRGWEGLTVALDSRQEAGRAYGVEGIPHTVVVGPDGKIAHVKTGYEPGGGREIADIAASLLENGKPADE